MSWRCPFQPAVPILVLGLIGIAACPGGKSNSVGGPGGGAAGSSQPTTIEGDGEDIHLDRSHPSDTHQDFVFNDDVIETGMLSKDAINKGVRERYAGLRQCYENLTLANPGLAGKLVVKFTIGIDGTVTEATAKGIHPDLETCIEGEIRKMKFPRQGGTGSVQVSYPFTFSP